jgi:hypothetical protein
MTWAPYVECGEKEEEEAESNCHKYILRFIDILLNKLDGTTNQSNSCKRFGFLFLDKLTIELCKCSIIEENYRKELYSVSIYQR